MLGGAATVASGALLAGCSGSSGGSGGGATLAPATTVASINVAAGQTYLVEGTTHTASLTVAEGGKLTVPDGYCLTLTVDGVETGQAIPTANGTTPEVLPGTYTGDVVLTVAAAQEVAWEGLTFPFRQAVYVDGSGVVAAKSVKSAITGGSVGNGAAENLRIISTGAVFTGVYVAGGTYRVASSTMSLTGNGRSDFVGYGTAVVGTGTDTTLVLDRAKITTKGVVRSAVVADGGANVVVKNSTIHTADGTLAEDYVPSVNLATMQSVPWMLSLSGNVRATNLVGTNTRATYIASAVSSQGWGVLSTDSNENVQLTAINSDLSITGEDGYGAYCNGSATLRFLGTRFTVPSYAVIATGGSILFGDSTSAAVAKLNSDLALDLSSSELAALKRRATVVDSQRFGVMWHGAGSLQVGGATELRTKGTTFLDKGQQVAITVDGSGGAKLVPENGVIFQLMTTDDPGPVNENGSMVNTGTYTEPTGADTRVSGFDPTTAGQGDANLTFSAITLKGSFYNAFRASGADGSSAGGQGGPGGAAGGKNMVLTFTDSKITGVITASTAKHAVTTITADNYRQLGEVTNTAAAVVNNGAIVGLAEGSVWTVTGTCHLSKLTLDTSSSVVASRGRGLTLTVDGVRRRISAGSTYTGEIVLRPS